MPNIRFHDLPHTTASLLLNHSVPVIEVCKRSVHTGAFITLDVRSHLIPSMQSEVSKLFDDLVIPIAIQIDQKVG